MANDKALTVEFRTVGAKQAIREVNDLADAIERLKGLGVSVVFSPISPSSDAQTNVVSAHDGPGVLGVLRRCSERRLK